MRIVRARILLVEDNASDVRLMKEAIRDAKAPTDLHSVSNGEQALVYLKGEHPFTGRPRPDLVILDLNLPRKHGLDVLAEIRADKDLCLLPVIVMTTSTAETDVRSAYAAGANCYIVKPVDFDTFREVVAGIDRFWLGMAHLPGLQHS